MPSLAAADAVACRQSSLLLPSSETKHGSSQPSGDRSNTHVPILWMDFRSSNAFEIRGSE
ncbi:hypothetical protein AKJ16_DCAP16546 [Drosera capensis]